MQCHVDTRLSIRYRSFVLLVFVKVSRVFEWVRDLVARMVARMVARIWTFIVDDNIRVLVRGEVVIPDESIGDEDFIRNFCSLFSFVVRSIVRNIYACATISDHAQLGYE